MAALELCLAASELPQLFRQAPFTGRRGRPASVEMVWHDTAGADLAADHLSLCECKGNWRLERASPRPGEAWPPGMPPPVVAEGADPDALGPWPGTLMPIAGFRGQQRTMTLATAEPTTLVALEGTLRGVAQERPVCRIVLRGDATVLMALSTQIAETVDAAPPRWSLATEATALARGLTPPPRRVGSPVVPPDASVGDAAALVIGHLTDVILAGVPAAAAGATPEAVHQMRVAVRRLRSGLSIFHGAAGGPAFEAVSHRLRSFGAVLGRARDWDVFLGGVGQDVSDALPGDARIAAMLAAAAKRREVGYTALRKELASAGFRQLAMGLVQLAALRPWELEADDEQAAALDSPARHYGATVMAKRRKQMLGTGADIAELPAEQLHDLRKKGKRLRYAAEFFAPEHGKGAKRFVRCLSGLQEALGHLNDGNAAGGLMAELPGGMSRGFAAGAVQGYAAARSLDARVSIARQWSKFRKMAPFWG